MNQPIRVAVYGTGSIGSRHLRVLSSIPDVEVMAVPVHVERRQELTAAGYRICDNLRDAANQGVKLAVIATETYRHSEDIAEAISLSLDVLAEKPLTSNVSSSRDLCCLANNTQRRLFVACVLRFNKGLNTFRDNLPEIGSLHSVRIECQSYLPDWRPGRPYRDSYSARKSDGGVLRDLVHEIDYAGWLYGWPEYVQAIVKNTGRLEIQSEEMAELMWETETVPVISVHLDYLSRPSRRRMVAFGERGTLEWDYLTAVTRLSLTGKPIQEFVSTQPADEMYLAQDLAFINGCSGTLDHRQTSCEEGVRALLVIEAAQRASGLHHEIEIDSI